MLIREIFLCSKWEKTENQEFLDSGWWGPRPVPASQPHTGRRWPLPLPRAAPGWAADWKPVCERISVNLKQLQSFSYYRHPDNPQIHIVRSTVPSKMQGAPNLKG